MISSKYVFKLPSLIWYSVNYDLWETIWLALSAVIFTGTHRRRGGGNKNITYWHIYINCNIYNPSIQKYSLLQIKYILFVGENAAGTDDITCKMLQAIQKQTLKQMSQQTPVLSLKPRKRGAQWLAGKKKLNSSEKFFTQHTWLVGQKMLSSAF